VFSHQSPPMSVSRSLRRRAAAVLSVVAVAILSLVGSASSATSSAGFAETGGAHRWLGTWAAAMLPPGATPFSAAGFTDQTVRQKVHISLGGAAVRLQLANTFGSAPLQVAEVQVALAAGEGAIRPGTSRRVTVNRAGAFTVPTGARVLSDPIPMSLRDGSDLTVSIYFDAPTGPATYHRQSRELTYVSAAGNHTGDPTAAQYPTALESWFFLDAVQVAARPSVGAVVALGDSITDGDGSTVGANRRWPDVLARRLQGLDGARRAPVLNAGIGANRLLNDSDLGGVNALARLDRDVLAQPGARTLIVLEGINDIGFSQFPPTPGVEPRTNVSAQEIIGGYQQIIERAHADGLRVLGGTLVPFRGSFYWDQAAETKRQQVNTWIRTSGAFDGVIDFDAVVRDRADPAVLAPQYDSGDHLHPSDAGYQAMGDAIDLSCLSPAGAQRVGKSCTRV
jgi:lysophospholipase L1-like esterase